MPIGSRLLRAPALLPLLAVLAAPAAGQVSRIENTATLRYSAADGSVATIRSNTAAFAVERRIHPTRISFLRPPDGLVLPETRCTADPLKLIPDPVDAAAVAASTPLAVLDQEDPFIIVVDDPGGDDDPTVRDTLTLEFTLGDLVGTIDLLETEVDSGVFAGGIDPVGPDAADDPCDVLLERGQRLALRHPGDANSLTSDNSILVDPAGYVFDSITGAVLDGATVTLLDERGAPARVFGEDGVSAYPASMVTGSAVTDASGRVYAAAHGRYRFPLIAPGSYTLRVDPPAGYVAPSVRTPVVLAPLRDPTGRPFTLSDDASYARVFVQGAEDRIADIPLDPSAAAVGAPATPLLLAKTASVRQASPGDLVEYRLELRGQGTATRAGLHLIDRLPAGLRYRRGSVRGAAEPVADADGRRLDFTLPAIGASGALAIRYAVSIAPAAPVGEALNRAQVLDGAAALSNEAIAAVRLQPLLFTDALTVLGRVTEGACGDPLRGRRGVAGVRLLMEDGTSVVTDRDGLYHIEGARPGRHVVQLDAASLPPSLEPVACDRDTRQAGSATSRFVEGVGGVVKRVDFQLRPTGRAAPAAALPAAASDEAAAGGNRDWLAGEQPGIAWLFPTADHNPRTPTIRVAIKHRPGQRVALSLAGRPVDPLSFDATDTGGAVAVSRWSGIPLVSGDNRLSARVLDADGGVAATLDRVVHVSGAPARVAVDAKASRLVADGLTQPLLAVRVTDRDGRPVRAGTLLAAEVDAPYRAAVQGEGARALAARDRLAASARVVGDDGVAFLALQPTSQPGALRVRLTLADANGTRQVRVSAALAPGARDWTVVGFGAGSLGYDTLSRHARPTTHGDALRADGQLALYAKGRIKGQWLLTLAYDSARAYDPNRGLLGVIDPDRYYTVYGDGSAQLDDAPTRRKLYLRLERRQAFALWGDFETGFTDTVLTRFSRTLNGAKAAYEGDRLRAAGFAAETDARHVRDEIRGNGLSGPYRLSARGIVPNSDQLQIETRDRFRSERIISRTAMARHLDYDIDPVLGTIRFRAPVLSRDAALNPNVIVVDYEVEGDRSGKLVAGGRVVARLAGGAVEVGASALTDGTMGAAALVGADLRAHLTPDTELRAEAATGGQGGLSAGQAFIAEAEHHGGGVDLLAYARQQDARFGMGQQNATEAGTRKLGLDGRVALTDRLSLSGTAWHQATLGTPATRIAADLRLEYRRQGSTLFAGVQVADDHGLDGSDRQSRLLTLGGSQSLLGGRLTLAGQTQWAPGGDDASTDFPARHQLTATYRLLPGVRLVGGYEIANGEAYTARTARAGVELAPWRGAALTGSVNQQGAGENGQRTYAQYGLAQSIPLGAHWTLDGTLDASTTLGGGIATGTLVNPLQPPASGGLASGDPLGGDYLATTLGAGYRAARWSWNGRVEHRRADAGTRWGLTANLLRALGEGRTAAASGKFYTVRDRAGASAGYAAADLALAVRPPDSRWSVLERLGLRRERTDGGFDDRNVLGVPASAGYAQATSRVVNNLALNYRTGAEGQGHGLEASVYYGAKYVRGRFADDLHDGFIHVVGFDLRRDLGRRLDIGAQGSVQHAASDGAVAWSGGPSVGVSPAGNWWLSAGWNLSGYRDRDFGEDRYTRAGPYLTFRLKFDQTGIAGAARSLLGGARR